MAATPAPLTETPVPPRPSEAAEPPGSSMYLPSRVSAPAAVHSSSMIVRDVASIRGISSFTSWNNTGRSAGSSSRFIARCRFSAEYRALRLKGGTSFAGPDRMDGLYRSLQGYGADCHRRTLSELLHNQKTRPVFPVYSGRKPDIPEIHDGVVAYPGTKAGYPRHRRG